MLQRQDILLQGDPFPKSATVYQDDAISAKAYLLYFHGGGLLFGQRTDLPLFHIQRLTSAGYPIIALDYPLAPAAKIDRILSDVLSSIQFCLCSPLFQKAGPLPYFLFGRSAGAYLSLLAAANASMLPVPPAGVLSFYGYGFLSDTWYETPAAFYQDLPLVSESCLHQIPSDIRCDGSLAERYQLYVYARQSGRWKSLFYEGREKYFLSLYSLRLCEQLPCPLFCAHSTEDPDVPFAEFTLLSQRYAPERLVVSRALHDFDRNVDDLVTAELLDTAIRFCGNALDRS